MRLCSKCNQEKSLDCFYVCTNGSVLRQCDECRLQLKREYNARTKQRRAEYTAKIPKEKRREKYLRGREKSKQRTYERFGTVYGWCTKLWSAAKHRAKSKDMEFSLPTDFIHELWEKQGGKCCLTGTDFELVTGGNCGYKRFNPNSASVDRIDNSKGYTPDNVRLVCTAINLAINEFGLENFEKLCEKFVNYRGKT